MQDEPARDESTVDDAVARAFVTGDMAAFDALYRRYVRPIHDYVTGVVRDRALAEDVTQTVFVRAYEQRASLRDPAAVRSWLYRIAHNLAINEVTRTRPTEQILDDAPLESPEPGPARLTERDEAVRLVWDAAASLESRQYAMLDLALRKGLSTAEIAVVLGLQPAQASLAVHRAREALGNAVRFLVVARRRRQCERLAGLVPEGVRSLTAEQRASVDRHLRRCATCQSTARVLTRPGELFATIPLIPIPVALVEHELASWGSAGHFAPRSAPSGRWVRRGMRSVPHLPAAAGSVAAAAVIAAAVVVGVHAHHQRTSLPAPPSHPAASTAGTSSSPAPINHAVTAAAVRDCPVPAAERVGVGASPQPPRRLRLPASDDVPPHAVVYATGEPGGGPVVFSVAPAGATCRAAFGSADDAQSIAITGRASPPGPGITAIINAGGAGPGAGLACPYIPAVARVDRQTGLGACTAPPAAEKLTALATGSPIYRAELVSVPTGVADPSLTSGKRLEVPTLSLVVAAVRSSPPSAGGQEISCSLTPSDKSLCRAALIVFARQSLLVADQPAEARTLAALRSI